MSRSKALVVHDARLNASDVEQRESRNIFFKVMFGFEHNGANLDASCSDLSRQRMQDAGNRAVGRARNHGVDRRLFAGGAFSAARQILRHKILELGFLFLAVGREDGMGSV